MPHQQATLPLLRGTTTLELAIEEEEEEEEEEDMLLDLDYPEQRIDFFVSLYSNRGDIEDIVSYHLGLGHGYLLMDYVGNSEVQMLSETWDEDHHHRDKRINLFRGLSRIMLSLSQIPLPRIGSWTLDPNGALRLSNRPLTLRLHQLENGGIPTNIGRTLTYPAADAYYLDLLAYDLTGEHLEAFKKVYEEFLDVFEEEEKSFPFVDNTHSYRTDLMRRAWQTGSFWHFHSLDSPKGLFNLFHQHIHPIFVSAHRVSSELPRIVSDYWAVDTETIISTKLQDKAEYEKVLRQRFKDAVDST
ncbi:hypothetical protein P875_00042703 [Aspergillus parasiticus SU-1]|uniref:Uncharacterized protein n=1 Tax=Aspergillus parasiticus (strain ATCC 56775 / NRRL 5862 / SRRC 143 / SU-1) TaxID=1403190 RepID=A0A0F0HZX6_ASPPU|nr:hypothetical protein P875_00042703 [Aspergillus parasiticus SU-1]